MKINERAPVIASGEIEVAADASIIWELMSSIDHWPEWNADVLSASLQGRIGSRIEVHQEGRTHDNHLHDLAGG